MTSGGKSICLASGGRNDRLCGSYKLMRCCARNQTITSDPRLGALQLRSCGEEGATPNTTYHGYSVTAGCKAIDTTTLFQTWHTVSVESIRLPAAMESTTTRPTDTSSNLSAYTLRDRDNGKHNKSVLHAISDFIGWRLENFRHLLASSPRAHYLPEWRG
jgi:hypothetical protein